VAEVVARGFRKLDLLFQDWEAFRAVRYAASEFLLADISDDALKVVGR
jgi:hypothetical protein